MKTLVAYFSAEMGRTAGVAKALAEKLGAEFVQAIGHKFTVYRESKTLVAEKRIVLP